MRIYHQDKHFLNACNVLMKKYVSNLSTHRHSHDFAEVVYVLSGAGIHEINGQPFPMSPGCFYIVNSGEIHNLKFSEPSVYYNIFLKENYLRDLEVSTAAGVTNALDLIRSTDTADHFVLFQTEKKGLVEALLNNLLVAFNQSNAEQDPRIRFCLSLLFLEYRSALSHQQSLRQPDFVLPRVIDYISQHYHENIQIAEIAEKYHYNPIYFGRLFMRYYRMPLKDYLIHLRLTAASELLETTSYNIDEIVARVGFHNKVHFYKKFQETFQCTPKEYRLRSQQRDNSLAVEQETPPAEPEPETALIDCNEWLENRYPKDQFFVHTAADASMSDVGIFPGDHVIFLRQKNAPTGSIVAFADPQGKIGIRQLYVLPGESKSGHDRYILHACAGNDRNEPDFYLDRVDILGVVADVLHTPRMPER